MPLDSSAIAPPAGWTLAVEDAFDRILQSAARPAHEAVAAAANAVLFADRAELLACLARDLLDGAVWTRWWWRELVRGGPATLPAVLDVWLESPAHVPAAVEILAAAGWSTEFVHVLPPAGAAQIAARVAVTFGAAALAEAIAAPVAAARKAEARASPRTTASTERRRVAAARPQDATPTQAPPWTIVVPEARAVSRVREHELLLGVALSLRRDPVRARSTEFVDAVARWLAAPVRHDELPAAPPVHAPRVRAPVLRPKALPPERAREPVTEEAAASVRPCFEHDRHADAGARKEPTTTELRPARRVVASPARPEPRAPEVGGVEVEPQRADRPPHERARPLGRARARTRLRAVEPAPAREPPARSRAEPTGAAQPPAEPLPPEEPLLGAVVETELGGLFFLLNVGLFLGLYSDFTAPQESGIPLDPWEFVALLGTRLLDEPNPDDPIWDLLRRLAPRGLGRRPGADFQPPRTWRIPRRWLDPFEHDGEWTWSAADGTLRLVHPAGFVVVAVPARGGPSLQLERELRRYGVRPRLRRAAFPRESRRPLQRWVDRLALYTAARVQIALGSEDRRRAVDTVLRRQARVYVTETHVDVSMPLFSLPIEIRLAGLDRDPGWIPAAGRFVSFHFE